MNADIKSIFYSPLFSLFDFKCHEEAGSVSKPEWRNNYYINFTRKGNFGYRLGKKFYDIHCGAILLENMETECIISHDHQVKDECTSLCVEQSLLSEIALAYSEPKYSGNYNEFSTEKFKFPSLVIRSTPQTEYIHNLIYQGTMRNSEGKILKIDLLIVTLLQQIFAYFSDTKQIELPIQFDKKLKDLHLETVSRGKKYLLDNFQTELNLADIAHNVNVSPFHFSRLFKHFTSYSPYRYLLELRLSHAVLLLRNTSRSVTEICFEAGFNSLAHFIATFTNHHGMSPLKFRNHRS